MFESEPSHCDRCKETTETNSKDHSKGCTGHPDSWEPSDWRDYCKDCGGEK